MNPPSWWRVRVPRRALLGGLALGLFYGLFVRAIVALPAASDLAGVLFVMTAAFLFMVPFAIGYLTIAPARGSSLVYRIVGPWLPTLLGVAGAMIVGGEGRICALLALPILLPLASIGGLVAGAQRGVESVHMTVVALCPLLFGVVEQQWPLPRAVYGVHTSVDIQAPPATVWKEIVSVRPIAPSELDDALYLRLGFPRPISAVINREGVGAIREARFDGGVLFLETVTDWAPPRRLRFTIAADTAAIPPTTLDSHVTVGSPFFDVLAGTYELEPLADGRTRLHLSSEMRLSTHFNWYAGPWAAAIMRSIQQTILEVERARAEELDR